MRGTYVGSNGKEIGILWWQWRWGQCGYNNSIKKARARGRWHLTSTGKARAMQQWHHGRSDEEEVKQLGKGAHQRSMQTGWEGCDGGTAPI
jgi:hypothetical protein